MGAALRMVARASPATVFRQGESGVPVMSLFRSEVNHAAAYPPIAVTITETPSGRQYAKPPIFLGFSTLTFPWRPPRQDTNVAQRGLANPVWSAHLAEAHHPSFPTREVSYACHED